MGKSLYRSYRSTSFDEVIGQEHVTTTLENSIKNDSIAHAYLLSGPRGVGKTSIARILAYAVNKIPYELENTHLDIIEIDAASNRRIDEVRDIREKVNILPTSGKYKVYIIDEVHMLTREAFNALLKTLEEPPAHVIFVLATTELNKVPETIVSRCITFTLKPISLSDLIKHLSKIAKKEHIKISKNGLELIASHSNGSFRDGITLLEQFKYFESNIEEKDVQNILGLPTKEDVEQIFKHIELNDYKKLSDTLSNIFDKGISVDSLSSEIHKYTRELFISATATNLTNNDLLELQRQLLSVPGSPKPKIELELALFKLIRSPDVKGDKTSSIESKKNTKPSEISEPVNETGSIEDTKENVVLVDDPDWSKALENIKKRNNTLYAIARMANANVNAEEGIVFLKFKFSFHEKQINESTNKAEITRIISETYNKNMRISTEVLEKKLQKSDTKNSPIINTVSNIFGDHEVLES